MKKYYSTVLNRIQKKSLKNPLKKFFIFFVIFSMFLQYNLSGAGYVFAQVATGSAITSSPISSIELSTEEISNSNSTGSAKAQTADLDNNNLSFNQSAMLGKIIVQTLSKKNFQYKDKISFNILNTLSQTFSVRVLNGKGKNIDFQIAEKDLTDKIQITVSPTGKFVPGKYTVEVIQDGSVVSSQDFIWGVLAINVNKSIYAPNDKADIAMAVLDENGELVCNAKVTLLITDPASTQTELSSENGKLLTNSVCDEKKLTLIPDYETSYQIGNLTGQYNLSLTAVTKNGKYSVTDIFQVEDKPMFDVERIAPTRIYPPLTYPVELKIKANEDFNGQVTDVVPDSFQISEASDSGLLKPVSIKIASANSASASATGPSVLGARALSLPFEGKPDVSLGFGEDLSLINPQERGLYKSFGLVGHDGIDFAMPQGTPILAVDDGNVAMASENGPYGWTVVIQHSWGRTYYGHLSQFLVKLGDNVSKGQQIAFSGATGDVTGPHLHFGVKPNNPDMQNGYFGKEDPASLLGLPTNGRVLGASVQNQETPKSKVLTWNIDIKKGETVNIGYQLKTPSQSPQFYTIGPAKFFDASQSAVFQEGRQWQLAVDDTTPTYQMQTGYYVGNTNPIQITGLGFRPQLVVLKSDTNVTAALFSTTAMPNSNTGYFIANADATTGTVNLEKDGFTVSSTASSANVRYTWIAFAGADCSSSGMFCIGEYTGDGAGTQAVSAVGFQPDLVWVKRSTAVDGNWRSSSMPNNNGQYFSATAADTTGALFTTLDTTGFTVGSTNNVSTGVYYYVAFKNTANAVAVGSYTGTGSANGITGVGFAPDWVFLNNADTVLSSVFNVRESYGDSSSLFTKTANLVGAITSLDSDGFSVGTNSISNGSGNTIYYAAFGGAAANSTGTGTFKMESGTYTGTGDYVRVSSLGFSPDLIIIKGDTTQYGVFRTSAMGGDTTAYLGAATANFAGGINAINPGGFTIGTSTVTNTVGATYYWTAYGNAWDPTKNTGASDFYIGAYYGNGVDSRDITRLPFQADMVTVKRSGATAGIFRTSSHSGDTSSYFAATADAANNVQAITSDGFEIGTTANVNTAANTYWYFGFKNGSDFTVGTYSGSGSSQNITSPAFQPDNIWVKRSTAVRGVLRTSDGAADSAIPFINVASITGAVTAIISTGFTVGTATETNASGGTYWYVVWRNNYSPSSPTYQMQTGYFVGNTNPVHITGLGFRPQLVVIKSNSNTIGSMFSSTAMPNSNTAYFIATADNATGWLNLENDGFTASGNADTASVRYTWIAFAGADCSSSGMFCIGEYTGDGAGTQAVSAVGFQPDLVWVKRSTAVTGNFRTSSMGTNVGQNFDATTQDTTGALFTTLDTTGFTVGSTNNVSTGVYYYVAFKNTANSVKVGSYSGTGSANGITGVGFKPDWVFVKNADAATPVSAVHNVAESYGDSSSYYSKTANLVGAITSLDSDGFSVGTNSTANGSGNTIYYAAFNGAAALSSGTGTFKMAKGTYTGTGDYVRVSAIGFSPDLVVIKGDTTQAGAFRTSMMGGDSTAYLDSATANFAGGIIAINPNGFTVGTSAVTNTVGVTYYWTAYGNAWDPALNDGASDFYIGAYYGNGVDSRDITRLPFQADLVTDKRSGATGGVFRTSSHSGDTSSYFAATNDAANNIQALNSDGFEIGTTANVNTAANMYFYFGFKNGSDFTAGSYTGNGSSQTISSVGFQPDSIWVKRSAGTATRGVERTSDGAADSALPFINVASITGGITSIVSNGFTVGSAAETNASSATYWYASWALASSGVETPTLAQLMRHGQWFNSSGIIQPFTF